MLGDQRDISYELNRLRDELARTRATCRQLAEQAGALARQRDFYRAELRLREQEVRYRLGDALIRALRPGGDTLRLPWRLLKLVRDGLSRRSARRTTEPAITSSEGVDTLPHVAPPAVLSAAPISPAVQRVVMLAADSDGEDRSARCAAIRRELARLSPTLTVHLAQTDAELDPICSGSIPDIIVYYGPPPLPPPLVVRCARHPMRIVALADVLAPSAQEAAFRAAGKLVHRTLLAAPPSVAAALVDRIELRSWTPPPLIVPPVLPVGDGQCHSRAARRTAWGVPSDQPLVLIRSGRGKITLPECTLQACYSALAEHGPTAQMLCIAAPVGAKLVDGARVSRTLAEDDALASCTAFDLIISPADGDATHTLLHYGVPSILVATNADPQMRRRAMWAHRALGTLAVVNADDVRQAVALGLSPAVQATMRAKGPELVPEDGAARVAELLVELLEEPAAPPSMPGRSRATAESGVSQSCV